MLLWLLAADRRAERGAAGIAELLHFPRSHASARSLTLSVTKNRWCAPPSEAFQPVFQAPTISLHHALINPCAGRGSCRLPAPRPAPINCECNLSNRILALFTLAPRLGGTRRVDTISLSPRPNSRSMKAENLAEAMFYGGTIDDVYTAIWAAECKFCSRASSEKSSDAVQGHGFVLFRRYRTMMISYYN